LRTYLDVMSRILLEHEGTIDKIMGDGILAFFGDPIPSENPSRQAVACGLAMQEAMTALSARWAQEGYGQLKIRVGVATGRVYVGNIGSSDHLEYTVIGPTVNLAARLESNAPAGGVLVAEPTMKACEADFDFERVTGLTLKGFGTDLEAFVCKGPRGAGVTAGEGAAARTGTLGEG
jgi:class 3 adenylate cyclase